MFIDRFASISPRRASCLAVALVGLTVPLVGCGSDDEADPVTTDTSSTTPLTTDSVAPPEGITTEPPTTDPVDAEYTIVSGDTISGIAARADVTVDALVEANGWTDGTDHLILPGDVIALPTGSSIADSPTTDSTSDDPAATDGDSSGGYRTTSSRLGFGDRTADVATPLADGVYWAQTVSSDGTTVTFTLGQLFRCDPQNPIADQPDLDCSGNTAAGLTSPSAQLTITSDAAVVLITGGTGEPVNLSVSSAEYARLVNGSSPASDAPAGFRFDSADRTLVEVSDGSVVTVEQIYTS